MDPVISINTLAYEGYDLTIALQELANIGVSHVELGFTRGFTQDLTESHFSKASADKFKHLFSDLGLSSIALSAHIDLTTPDAVEEMKRRIDFGKRLGVGIVNTKVGARTGRTEFLKNIEPIAKYAESMDIVVGLENPAEGSNQIITNGKTGAEVIKTVGSDYIKLNYDFGNAYTYSKGKVDPVVDYKQALPHACYFHLKDMEETSNGWKFAQIGEGVIDYAKIFKELLGANAMLSMSIEQLFIYNASPDFIVYRLEHPPSLSHINMNLENSIGFVKNLIGQFRNS